MCSQKNSKALAASAGGGVSARELPGKRAASLQSGSDAASNVSVSQLSRSTNGAAHADSRDRASASEIWLPKDPRAAESRGLESREMSSGTELSGRGINAAAAAETTPAGSGTPAGAFSSDRAQPGVVDGLCGRPTSGRKKISIAHRCGYLYMRMPSD